MNTLVSLLSLLAWGAWGYIVLYVDPTVPLAPLGFYAALFLALTCTIARLRAGAAVTDADGERLVPSPRIGHAASVTTVALFALWLQSLRMLTPMNATLLLTTLVIIELGFFLTRGRPKVRARRRARRTSPEPSADAAET